MFKKYVVLGMLITLLISCGDEREFILAKKQRLVESVYSSIVLEPENLYNVTASLSGYLDAVVVKPGDLVDLGDTLFVIRDVAAHATASNAMLNYALARDNYRGESNLLEDLTLEFNSLRLKAKNDSLGYSRSVELYKSGVITKVEMERSELNYQTSRNSLSSLNKRIKRLEGELRTNLSQARNNYENSLSRFNDAVIRSRIKGRVYDVLKEPGEFVTVQQNLGSVGEENDFKIVMLVDEEDVTKLEIGQEVIVSLEAFPGRSFQALLTRIAPKMDNKTQSFEVEAKFKEKLSKSYMGLTGEANIIVAEKANTVVIPREYLRADNRIETDRGMVRVRLGIHSLSHVEIISGLKNGEKVYKPE